MRHAEVLGQAGQILQHTVSVMDVSGVGSIAQSGLTGSTAGVVLSIAGGPGIPVGGGRKLALDIASKSQMAEAAQGLGKIIATGADGTFRDAAKMAEKYGGQAADYAKKTSSTIQVQGKGWQTQVETHWIENVKTGQQFEFKTKIRPDGR